MKDLIILLRDFPELKGEKIRIKHNLMRNPLYVVKDRIFIIAFNTHSKRRFAVEVIEQSA
jgi:hypothetical protein